MNSEMVQDSGLPYTNCCSNRNKIPKTLLSATVFFPPQKSSGFVYGVMGLVDKTSLGLIVLALQENYPKSTG